jgi:hypothetical protein
VLRSVGTAASVTRTTLVVAPGARRIVAAPTRGWPANWRSRNGAGRADRTESKRAGGVNCASREASAGGNRIGAVAARCSRRSEAGLSRRSRATGKPWPAIASPAQSRSRHKPGSCVRWSENWLSSNAPERTYVSWEAAYRQNPVSFGDDRRSRSSEGARVTICRIPHFPAPAAPF